MSEMIEKLKAYLQTEEGKASQKRFTDSMVFYHNVYLPKWIGKIKEKIDEHSADYVIEKLITKYRSDEYRDREYKCRREPEEKLFYLLLCYCREYCVPCEEDRYWGSFVPEAYNIGSYIITLCVGQGSFIGFEKVKS